MKQQFGNAEIYWIDQGRKSATTTWLQSSIEGKNSAADLPEGNFENKQKNHVQFQIQRGSKIQEKTKKGQFSPAHAYGTFDKKKGSTTGVLSHHSVLKLLRRQKSSRIQSFEQQSQILRNIMTKAPTVGEVSVKQMQEESSSVGQLPRQSDGGVAVTPISYGDGGSWSRERIMTSNQAIASLYTRNYSTQCHFQKKPSESGSNMQFWETSMNQRGSVNQLNIDQRQLVNIFEKSRKQLLSQGNTRRNIARRAGMGNVATNPYNTQENFFRLKNDEIRSSLQMNQGNSGNERSVVDTKASYQIQSGRNELLNSHRFSNNLVADKNQMMPTLSQNGSMATSKENFSQNIYQSDQSCNRISPRSVQIKMSNQKNSTTDREFVQGEQDYRKDSMEDFESGEGMKVSQVKYHGMADNRHFPQKPLQRRNQLQNKFLNQRQNHRQSGANQTNVHPIQNMIVAKTAEQHSRWNRNSIGAEDRRVGGAGRSGAGKSKPRQDARSSRQMNSLQQQSMKLKSNADISQAIQHPPPAPNNIDSLTNGDSTNPPIVGQLASLSKHSTIPNVVLDKHGETCLRRSSQEGIQEIQVQQSNQQAATPIIEIKRIDGELFSIEQKPLDFAKMQDKMNYSVVNNTILENGKSHLESVETSPQKSGLDQSGLAIQDSRFLNQSKSATHTSCTQKTFVDANNTSATAKPLPAHIFDPGEHALISPKFQLSEIIAQNQIPEAKDGGKIKVQESEEIGKRKQLNESQKEFLFNDQILELPYNGPVGDGECSVPVDILHELEINPRRDSQMKEDQRSNKSKIQHSSVLKQQYSTSNLSKTGRISKNKSKVNSDKKFQNCQIEKHKRMVQEYYRSQSIERISQERLSLGTLSDGQQKAIFDLNGRRIQLSNQFPKKSITSGQSEHDNLIFTQQHFQNNQKSQISMFERENATIFRQNHSKSGSRNDNQVVQIYSEVYSDPVNFRNQTEVDNSKLKHVSSNDVKQSSQGSKQGVSDFLLHLHKENQNQNMKLKKLAAQAAAAANSTSLIPVFSNTRLIINEQNDLKIIDQKQENDRIKMQQLFAKSQQIQDHISELKDERLFELKLQQTNQQLFLRKLNQKDSDSKLQQKAGRLHGREFRNQVYKTVKQDTLSSPERSSYSPPERRRQSQQHRQQTPGTTGNLNRNQSFDKRHSSLTFNKLSDQIKSVEFLLKANKINTISERDLQTKAAGLAKNSSSMNSVLAEANIKGQHQPTLDEIKNMKWQRPVVLRNSVLSNINTSSREQVVVDMNPPTVRLPLSIAWPNFALKQSGSKFDMSSYEKFKAHQQEILSRGQTQHTQGTQETEEIEERAARDSELQSTKQEMKTLEKQDVNEDENKEKVNHDLNEKGMAIEAEKNIITSQNVENKNSQQNLIILQPRKVEKAADSVTPRFDEVAGSQRTKQQQTVETFRIQEKVQKVQEEAPVSKQQFSFHDIDLARRAEMQKNSRGYYKDRDPYQKQMEEELELMILQSKLEQRQFQRYVRRLQKLTQICKIDGLISNETMVNRCSYKRIQRGPQKIQSMAQKVFNKKLINMLMQEEPIERMNRGLVRGKNDSVKHLAREIVENRRGQQESANLTTQSLISKGDVEAGLIPKTKSPIVNQSINNSRLVDEYQMESQEFSNQSLSMTMAPKQQQNI